MNDNTCAIVIPSRIGSNRLPNKPLLNVAGKPLISWVIEAAFKVDFKPEVIVATDDKRIKKLAESLGAKSIMTSKDCKNGTARILEIIDEIDTEFIINLQGDEPLVSPNDLNNLFIAIKSRNNRYSFNLSSN